MKFLLLALLLTTGCSSKKKDKDFQESFKQNDPAAEVQVEAPAPLLEKFEVVDNSTPAPKLPEAPKPEVTKKTATLTPAKKVIAAPKLLEKPLPVANPVATPSKIPEDYPAALLAINAKAEKVWKSYKPNHQVDEKVFLDIHYLGMTVGKIMVINKGKKMINGKEVWHPRSELALSLSWMSSMSRTPEGCLPINLELLYPPPIKVGSITPDCLFAHSSRDTLLSSTEKPSTDHRPVSGTT